MNNVNVLNPMISLKRDMLDVSAKLSKLGYIRQAYEMKGAARILQGWINEVRRDLQQPTPTETTDTGEK